MGPMGELRLARRACDLRQRECLRIRPLYRRALPGATQDSGRRQQRRLGVLRPRSARGFRSGPSSGPVRDAPNAYRHAQHLGGHGRWTS